jgi:hypothetical protein
MIFLFLGSCLVAGQPEAIGPDRLLDNARALQLQIEEAKRQGRETRTLYRNLLEVCVQLRKTAPTRLPLCIDEGHAASLAGDWPHALLAYRLAQRLDPSNDEVTSRLRIVRARLLLADEPANVWDEVTAALASNNRLRGAFLLLAFTLYGAAWLRIAGLARHREGRGTFFALVGMATALGLIAALFWVDDCMQRLGSQPLVVVRRGDPVVLREGNGLSYPAATEERLRAGNEAVLLNRRGNWLHVRTARGQIGWIPTGTAEVE